jgi:hypothetical protein
MTEEEWLASTDPAPMLRSLVPRWVARQTQGAAVDFERLRLFACACCRRAWDILDDQHRRSVEMIEDFVRTRAPDGLRAARRVRWAAGNRASSAVSEASRAFPAGHPAQHEAWARNVASSAVWRAADRIPTRAASCHGEVAQAVASLRQAQGLTGTDRLLPDGCGRFVSANELAAQAALLRDIAGNPFRTVNFDPAWLARGGGTLRSLARAVYDERSFDRLSILADALEEAGCDNPDVLDHCRGPGEHVRGCWVIDLLLGKE